MSAALVSTFPPFDVVNYRTANNSPPSIGSKQLQLQQQHVGTTGQLRYPPLLERKNTFPGCLGAHVSSAVGHHQQQHLGPIASQPRRINISNANAAAIMQQKMLAAEASMNGNGNISPGQHNQILANLTGTNTSSQRQHNSHAALCHSMSVNVIGQKSPLSSLGRGLTGDLPLHKKLDRSMSEPAEKQQRQPSQANSSRYKTELCRPFEENGTCKYGDKCQFAHGYHELRNLQRHPKYKTELCRTFHTTGFCPYGPRCHFIHNSEETKKSVMNTLQAGGFGSGTSGSSSSSTSSDDDLNDAHLSDAQLSDEQDKDSFFPLLFSLSLSLSDYYFDKEQQGIENTFKYKEDFLKRKSQNLP